ncbi:formate-dependent nitrite reductase complex subunit NrfG [Ferrimonas sediminum]|uniref:Formate-dependent nitrite reductase complex subunit NrfG n=1 Tax=Ferrimonas sediminum TaxID=718193 RepID=A0A1G8Z7X1_9GAMM|nr:hypothetical protein [Ferrimonas sediminum]SDK10515.1 formate-dependent nitrite reductase complex subunit NrfG [Ferrimonas sediminum]
MNSLSLVLALVLLATTVTVTLSHRHVRRQCQSGAEEPPFGIITVSPWWLAWMLICLILSSSLLYGQLGRYGDWNSGVVQDRVDYLLQAAINQSRMEADTRPQDSDALMQLADSYASGGKYDDAVTVIEQLISLDGESAQRLGLKAKYLYYRDNRKLGNEALAAVSKALKLDNSDVTTREFMATQAYRKGAYGTAIEHWQVILDSGNGGAYRRAIESAITRAQAKQLAARQQP